MEYDIIDIFKGYPFTKIETNTTEIYIDEDDLGKRSSFFKNVFFSSWKPIKISINEYTYMGEYRDGSELFVIYDTTITLIEIFYNIFKEDFEYG